MTQNTQKPEPVVEKAPTKNYTVTLGFSSLMTALTAFVGCVVVAFMMGVIVGRDDGDELTLAQIVAERERSKTEASTQSPAQGETTPTTNTEKESAVSSLNTAEIPNLMASSHAKVMPAEELKYATALKSKSSNTPPAKEAAPKKAATSQESTKKESAAEKKEPSVETKPTDKNALYDYVYQVASLKEETAVDKLRAQLEGEGLRTRMSKSGEYLKVLVLLRGTTEQALALQDRMVELKLGKPLQQEKKAVE